MRSRRIMRIGSVGKFGAVAFAGLGLVALLLVILANAFGVRVGGFEVLYGPGLADAIRVSLPFAIAAAFWGLHRAEVLRGKADRIRVTIEPGRPHSGEIQESAYEPDADGQGPTPLGLAQVRFEGVSKTYDLGLVKVRALEDVTLEIPAGSLTVVLGPSGSGKTTLLNLLGGIDRASAGRILVDGSDVTALDEKALLGYRRDRVGFVFQFFNLIPSLTARENVALAAELSPDAGDPEEVLRKVGLGERMNHFPAELSGGEQQRVAIARALVKNPPLLLCDEPTGELDYATGVRILSLLRDLARRDGRAVIVVTHNAVIGEAADTVVHLRGGRVDRVDRHAEPVAPHLLRW